jgi:hypothetical protein
MSRYLLHILRHLQHHLISIEAEPLAACGEVIGGIDGKVMDDEVGSRNSDAGVGYVHNGSGNLMVRWQSSR